LAGVPALVVCTGAAEADAGDAVPKDSEALGCAELAGAVLLVGAGVVGAGVVAGGVISVGVGVGVCVGVGVGDGVCVGVRVGVGDGAGLGVAVVGDGDGVGGWLGEGFALAALSTATLSAASLAACLSRAAKPGMVKYVVELLVSDGACMMVPTIGLSALIISPLPM